MKVVAKWRGGSLRPNQREGRGGGGDFKNNLDIERKAKQRRLGKGNVDSNQEALPGTIEKHETAGRNQFKGRKNMMQTSRL